MNKSLILSAIATILALALYQIQVSNTTADQFSQWKQSFGTPFTYHEEPYRRLIFEKNLKIILAHNTDSTQTYQKGINQFTIYSKEQFKAMVLSEMIIPDSNQLQVKFKHPVPNIDIDWTTKGAVSKVKIQGLCASAWAFGATGACQSWALIKGRHIDLSQQQLIDCSSAYGNTGCTGGLIEYAMKYIKDHGITTESTYPYVAKTQSCQKKDGEFKISSFTQLDGCSGLYDGIAKQPVAITVDAQNWNDYKSGVFSNCGQRLNHAALLVGVINGVWKIKNQWGVSWGENGFIRLASGNTCGICLHPGVVPN